MVVCQVAGKARPLSAAGIAVVGTCLARVVDPVDDEPGRTVLVTDKISPQKEPFEALGTYQAGLALDAA